jgi:hypothetical protein
MHQAAMPMTITYQPDQICVGFVRASQEAVVNSLQTQLRNVIGEAQHLSDVGPVDWETFFDGKGLLYDMRKFQIAIFSPHPQSTVYVNNLADGWLSLFERLVKTEMYDATFFRATLCIDIEFKVFEMIAWNGGLRTRELRALRDDNGWEFLNNGNPKAFEYTERYTKRQIALKLDRELMETYSASLGYAIDRVTSFTGPCCRLWRSAAPI